MPGDDPFSILVDNLRLVFHHHIILGLSDLVYQPKRARPSRVFGILRSYINVNTRSLVQGLCPAILERFICASIAVDVLCEQIEEIPRPSEASCNEMASLVAGPPVRSTCSTLSGRISTCGTDAAQRRQRPRLGRGARRLGRRAQGANLPARRLRGRRGNPRRAGLRPRIA